LYSHKGLDEIMTFERIAIIGVGLIGGSLGRGLKRLVPAPHVLGIGRNRSALTRARQMGAIDSCASDTSGLLRDRDLIVLATPVDDIVAQLGRLGDELGPGAVVTDVGSTKRRICEQAWRCLPTSVEFIGGHPVAGREVAGVESSLPNLFVGAPYVLCPQAAAGKENLARLQALIERLGARVHVMTPEEHDREIAWVSHLPQLLSTALADLSTGDDVSIAGTGFRDMIRLAASPYSVWQGIVDSNADNIDRALGRYIAGLERLRARLKDGRLSEDFGRAVSFCKLSRP
jgi:prephenate dehydrogenase